MLYYYCKIVNSEKNRIGGASSKYNNGTEGVGKYLWSNIVNIALQNYTKIIR